MTEEQAKSKWCPQSRVGSGQSGLGGMNRDAHATPVDPTLVERHSRCIASACMAWRERRDEVHTYPDGGGTVVRVELNGYCGLAGQPS